MQPIQSSKSAFPQNPQSRNYQHNNQEFHLNQQRHRLPMPGGLSHYGPSRRPPTPDGQLYRPRPPPVRLPPPGAPPPGVSAPSLAPSMALPLPDFSRPPPNISVPPPTTNQPFGGAFMRGPPPAINRPSHDITRPPPAINRPPHAINRPPHAINRPPPAINCPPPAIDRPPSAITRPPPVHYGPSPFDNTRTDVRARKPFPLQNQNMPQSMPFQNRPSLGPRRPPPPPCSMARPPFQCKYLTNSSDLRLMLKCRFSLAIMNFICECTVFGKCVHFYKIFYKYVIPHCVPLMMAANNSLISNLCGVLRGHAEKHDPWFCFNSSSPWILDSSRLDSFSRNLKEVEFLNN